MKDICKDVILFDHVKMGFVKKSELSEDSRKAYQEHAVAHMKMIGERYKNKNKK